jgi:hypothetical protein
VDNQDGAAPFPYRNESRNSGNKAFPETASFP